MSDAPSCPTAQPRCGCVSLCRVAAALALALTAAVACPGCPEPRYAEVAVADLPLFPGAHDVMHVRRPYGKGPPGPMNMILYRVDINYPSREVLQFYVAEAAKRGWRQVTPDADTGWEKSTAVSPSGQSVQEMSCRWIDAAQHREIGLMVFGGPASAPAASDGSVSTPADDGGERVTLAVRPYYSTAQ